MTDSRHLAGKVALVTGGTSGLGLAYATALADRGAAVAVTDIREDALKAATLLFAERSQKLLAVKADNRSVQDVESAVTTIQKAAGSLDIIVNNAGVSGFSLGLEQIDEQAFTTLFDTHVKGAFFVTRAAIPMMKANRHGRIINISSNFAMTGHDCMSHYVSAKSAMLGLTKAWAREFAPFNITVNAVAPGLVATPMTQNSIGASELEKRAQAVPLGRLARPEDVAYAVAWLASDEAAMMTGQVVSPNGGVSIVGI